jgi:hypothetical protein
MQVQVDSRAIAELEGQISYLMNLLRAMAVKEADKKGDYRLAAKDVNAADGWELSINQLKTGSYKMRVKKPKEES